MRATLLIFICILCLTSAAMGQVEQGDTEIQFMGYIAVTSGMTMGTIQTLIGYYVSPNLQVGAGPAITITSYSFPEFNEYTYEMEDNTETNIDLSLSLFGTYNFSTNEQMIPYVTATIYQYSFDIPEGMDFTDFSYLTFGGGIKYFLNAYVAVNSSATYGIPLGGGSGMLLLFGGLSVFL